MSFYNPDAAMARGLHVALTNSVPVQAILGSPPRLYDNAPEDPIFPYLTYGTARSEDISGDNSLLTSHTLTLHLWSRYAGRAEMLELINVIRNALTDTALAFSECHLVSLTVTYSDIFRAADGRTLHGVIRLSARTEPLIVETA